MRNIEVAGKTLDSIQVAKGGSFRPVIGKVMTTNGFQDFYRSINFQTDFITAENMTLQTASTYNANPIETEPPVLYFDGTSQAVTIANTNNRLQPNDQFTWEMWFKLESYTQYNTLMAFSSNNLDFGRMDATTKFQNHTWNALNQQPFITPSGFPPVDDGEWHHMAIVWDGVNGQRWGFIDGIQRYYATMAAGSQIKSSEAFPTFTIGGATPTGRLINGWIKDVRMWQIARTQDEIISSMNSVLTGNEEGLFLYLPLNEGSGDRVIDKASGFEASINGATWQGGGSISVEVLSTVGFVPGQVITITDGVSSENVKILDINGNILLLTPVKNNYPRNSIVARSTAKIDGAFSFGTRNTYTIEEA